MKLIWQRYSSDQVEECYDSGFFLHLQGNFDYDEYARLCNETIKWLEENFSPEDFICSHYGRTISYGISMLKVLKVYFKNQEDTALILLYHDVVNI